MVEKMSNEKVGRFEGGASTLKSCGVCKDRCPAGAITVAGRNKHVCFSYMNDYIGHVKGRYGVEITGCGLCQTRVPCELKISLAATRDKK